MLVGGCAGSTAGGVKIVRLLDCLESGACGRCDLTFSPNAVISVAVGRGSVPEDSVRRRRRPCSSYGSCAWGVGAVLLAVGDVDIVTAASGVDRHALEHRAGPRGRRPRRELRVLRTVAEAGDGGVDVARAAGVLRAAGDLPAPVLAALIRASRLENLIQQRSPRLSRAGCMHTGSTALTDRRACAIRRRRRNRGGRSGAARLQRAASGSCDAPDPTRTRAENLGCAIRCTARGGPAAPARAIKKRTPPPAGAVPPAHRRRGSRPRMGGASDEGSAPRPPRCGAARAAARPVQEPPRAPLPRGRSPRDPASAASLPRR